MKAKLEYVWLDGYQPTQSLRSKTLVRKAEFSTVQVADGDELEIVSFVGGG